MIDLYPIPFSISLAYVSTFKSQGYVPPLVATVEGSLLSTSAPPTGVSLPEDPPQLVNGHHDRPAPKKQKVAARAIISESISDK